MKRNLPMRFLTLSIFIAVSVTECVAKEWRGIIPLKSTRADVEKLLGANEKRDIVTYHLDDSTVLIWYSRGPCSLLPSPEWNVPQWTVTSVHVFLKEAVELSSHSFDLRKFHKVPGDSDLPDHFYYVNKEEGFGVEVQNHQDSGREAVIGYLYGPTWKDRNLRCKK